MLIYPQEDILNDIRTFLSVQSDPIYNAEKFCLILSDEFSVGFLIFLFKPQNKLGFIPYWACVL